MKGTVLLYRGFLFLYCAHFRETGTGVDSARYARHGKRITDRVDKYRPVIFIANVAANTERIGIQLDEVAEAYTLYASLYTVSPGDQIVFFLCHAF